MKRLIIFLGLLCCAAPSYGQTIEELQAQLDSLKAVQITAASQIKANELNAGRTQAVIDFGLIFYADSVDSMAVQIDFPLSTATGYKRALVIGSIEECVSGLGAIATDTVGRYRIRWDKAKRARDRLARVLSE